MQIKIREKQPKKNLEIPIILLYYYNILQKSAGCHLFLRMKRQHKKKDRAITAGPFPKNQLKKIQMMAKTLTYSLKGFQENFLGNSPRG